MAPTAKGVWIGEGDDALGQRKIAGWSSGCPVAVPVYVIDFTCTVSSGVMQLYVDCNGVRYYSVPMPAVGTYYTRANCYPYQITNFGAISLA
jgi:hypothetical protein